VRTGCPGAAGWGCAPATSNYASRTHRQDDGTVTARHPQGWTIHPAPCHDPGPEPATHVTRGTSHIHRRAIIPDWAGDPLHLTDSIHALVSKLPDTQPSAA
jgi:hypothetical protein